MICVKCPKITLKSMSTGGFNYSKYFRTKMIITRLNNKNFLKPRLLIFAMYMIVVLVELNYLFLFIWHFLLFFLYSCLWAICINQAIENLFRVCITIKKVNLSSFEFENFFKFVLAWLAREKTKHLDDATTMFTYSMQTSRWTEAIKNMIKLEWAPLISS